MSENTEAAVVTEEQKEETVWEPNPNMTHRSLAAFVTKNSGVEVSPEQAQAILRYHGQWQKSPSRESERVAEKEEKRLEAARKAAERAQATELRKAELAKAKAEKAAKATKEEKVAKSKDNSDLKAADAPEVKEGEAAPAEIRQPRKRRDTPAEF